MINSRQNIIFKFCRQILKPSSVSLCSDFIMIIKELHEKRIHFYDLKYWLSCNHISNNSFRTDELTKNVISLYTVHLAIPYLLK